MDNRKIFFIILTSFLLLGIYLGISSFPICLTATALSYDLTKDGYQAIDIGHIDLEYMWMKMGAKTQCAIPGKYVNEVPFGDVVEQVDNISNQVLCRVL